MTTHFILGISNSSGVAQVIACAEPDASNLDVPEIFSFEITDYKSQSAQLLPLIQHYFKINHLSSLGCVAIAVDVGPGGFTSLRTACGIAQGLALAWSLPTIVLTSFECMLPKLTQQETTLVLIDAKLNEMYAARIQRNEQGTQWIESPHLLPISVLVGINVPMICDSHLYKQLSSPAEWVTQGKVTAIQLARLAWQEFRVGRLVKPVDCQPLYVRNKIAQTTSERLALKHVPL
jgi:tRNA threonylcarbamoyladenosine biosynthesis protein TsaB